MNYDYKDKDFEQKLAQQSYLVKKRHSEYQDDYGVTECFENQFGKNKVRKELNTKNIITKTLRPKMSFEARIHQQNRNQTIDQLSSEYTRDYSARRKVKKKIRIG